MHLLAFTHDGLLDLHHSLDDAVVIAFRHRQRVNFGVIVEIQVILKHVEGESLIGERSLTQLLDEGLLVSLLPHITGDLVESSRNRGADRPAELVEGHWRCC
jgi:hypothetical protein